MTIKKAKRKLPLHDYSIVKATVPFFLNFKKRYIMYDYKDILSHFKKGRESYGETFYRNRNESCSVRAIGYPFRFSYRRDNITVFYREFVQISGRLPSREGSNLNGLNH